MTTPDTTPAAPAQAGTAKPDKVIFRIFPDSEVIALFPEIPESCDGWHCMSYMHVGQHSGASPFLVNTTKPAKPEQYASLKRELEAIGYTLTVQRRFHRNALAVRRANLNR